MDKTIFIETSCVSSRTTFTWKIRDFSMCPLSFGENVSSEIFVFEGSIFSLEACLMYAPNDSYDIDIWDERDHEEEEWHMWNPDPIPSVQYSKSLVVKINFKKKSRERKIICKISLLDTNKQNKCISLSETWQYESEYSTSLLSEGELLNRKDDFLTDDCLTIVCECIGSGIKQDQKKDTILGPSYESLCRDFGRLFTTEKYSDVDVLVEGQVIRAHSLILSARSEVLSAMFEHDMKERCNKVINIIDFSASCIRHFLHYLYTNEVSDIENLPSDLLVELYTAADKYAVVELKDMCSQAIVANVSEMNVTQYTSLAFKHSDQKMMDSIARFFAKNRNLINSELWQELVKEIPVLANQVLLEIAK